jgi:hypothetical protein
MQYEIAGLSEISAPSDVDGIYDNPKSAKVDLEYLRKTFPWADFAILRNGTKLTEAELVADIESYEIQAFVEAETKLPATYRHGLGHRTDDIAIGPNENPVKVWGPENPEDRHE